MSEQRLRELADTYNRVMARSDARSPSLALTIEAGSSVDEAFSLLPPGTQRDWIKTELTGAWRRALRARRLYHYRDEIPAHIDTAGDAEIFLRGRPAVGDNIGKGAAGVRRLPTEKKEEALSLVAQGIPKWRVAEMLGLSHSTVYKWCDPDKYAKSWQRSRQKLRQAEKALQNQRRDEARRRQAQRLGGGLGKVYSTVRVLLVDVDTAINEALSPSVKTHLRNGRNALAEAEQFINQALSHAYENAVERDRRARRKA